MEQAADELLAILKEKGFFAYKVGGFVRDKLLGLPVQDIDIATSASPDQVMSLFPKVIPTGIQHGTVTVHWKEQSFEVTTFRKDLGYADHRHPLGVEFVDDITVDLGRRDFTINAMAMDLQGNLIDPFHGKQDLGKSILRAVGNPYERFEEDALRILRGLRFSIRYALQIESATWTAMKATSAGLNQISKERIRDEMIKMIEGDHPVRAIDLLAAEGILPFSDWRSKALKLSQHPNKHWTNQCENTALRWAALCFEDSAEEAKQFLMLWRFPKKFIQEVAVCLEIAQLPLEGEREAKRLLLRYGIEKVKQCRALSRAFYNPFTIDDECLNHWDQQILLRDMKQLAVTGEDLLLDSRKPSGPWIGKTLQYLFEQVSLEGMPNDRELLLKEARKLG